MDFTPERLSHALDDCLRRPGVAPGGLCVALSGGLDSTALLAAPVELRRSRPAVALRAVHVDHGLHDDSAGWAEACARLAASLGVPLESVRVDARPGRGDSPEALNRMLNKMKDYAATEKYEKAAEIKQVIDLILAQTHKSSLLAEPVNKANVLFEITEGINHDYILLLEGKYFIKKNSPKGRDSFEDALNDYYSHTIKVDIKPTEEDLEKMNISLNWLTKNRNKVRIFYLKDFGSKEELFNAVSSNKSASKKSYRNFNLKRLAVSDTMDD